MNFYLLEWKNRQDVKIPPVSKSGFSQDVIIRKNIDARRNVHHIQISEPEEDMTILLKATNEYYEEDATVLVEQKRIMITVVRIKTGEEKEIVGNSFVIGKAKDCDFVITGNPTISRYHARIRKENEEYVLEDMDSLNHTYVGTYELVEPVKVMKDMIFQLSDEEFKVSVEIK